MAAQNQISSTSQAFLEVYDITGDVVVLKDGATSMILSVNAINFGLLAEEEQDAIIYAYAGLLNSLNYSIQILITSQTKDVSKYLHQLEEQEELSTDRVRQGQIRQYREFVSTLIRERNVLDKKFYVVIPATALEMGFLPPSTVVPGAKAPDISTVERSVILERARNILEPKRDHLLGQFARIGLSGRQLQTQEIIQLFYSSYNPEATEGQQITDSGDYVVPIVSARVQGAYMTDAQTPLVNPQVGATPSPTPTPTPGLTPNPTPSPTPDPALTPAPAPAPTAVSAPNPAPTPTPEVAPNPAMPPTPPVVNPVPAPVTPAPITLTPLPQTPSSAPAQDVSQIPNQPLDAPSLESTPTADPATSPSNAVAANGTSVESLADAQNAINGIVETIAQTPEGAMTPVPQPQTAPQPPTTPVTPTTDVVVSETSDDSSNTQSTAALPPLPEI